MKKFVAIVLICMLVLSCTITITACKNTYTAPVYSDTPTQFESREQVIEVVESYSSYYELNDDILSDVIFGLLSCSGFGCGKADSVSDYEESMSDGMMYSSKGVSLYEELDTGAGTSDYTKTNVQEESLDEGDIVKTDGANIYYLSDGGLIIISVGDNGTTAKEYCEKYENFIPLELYCMDNRIAVIGHKYERVSLPTSSYYNCCYMYGYGDVYTCVQIYDVTNPAAPVKERSITIGGYMNTTRLSDDGYLYMLSDYTFNYGDEETYIPYIIDSANGGEKQELEIANMYYFEGVTFYGYSIFAKINLNDTSDFIYKAYLGAGDNVYVSANNIYLSVTDYSARYLFDESTGFYDIDYDVAESSRIAKFSLDTLEFQAVGKVEGSINDRYSMDEYEGNLRVATSTLYGEEDYSNIFVMGENMDIIGSATGIAKGEQIYSARFSGTVGNIVTYRQIDPLFKIDLSDPTNPIVSEGLKKSGVSYYLQYLDGTDLLIGIGYGTEAEDAVRTNNMIEVALFDNSGTESTIINRLYIGSDDAYAYSDALYDAHCIVYDKDRDIFAFPATITPDDGSCPISALYVYGFSEGELKLKAILSNISDKDVLEYGKGTGVTYLEITWKSVERGVRIGDYIYTLSNAKIVGYSLLNDFAKVGETILSVASYDEDGNLDIVYDNGAPLM